MGELNEILNKIKANSNIDPNNFNNDSESNDNELFNDYVDDVYNYFNNFTECEYLQEDDTCECPKFKDETGQYSITKKCPHAKTNTFVLCEYSQCQKT